MKINFVISLAAVTLLAACSSGGSSPDNSPPSVSINSGFATASRTGTISELDETFLHSRRPSKVTDNSVGFAVGRMNSGEIKAVSAIGSGAKVKMSSGSGTATMTGRFRVAIVGAISQSGDAIKKETALDLNDITVNVDFGAGTLTGSGVGRTVSSGTLLRGNKLTLNGKINGDKLTGTAVYDGVSGPLEGLVGTDEAIGAFHGHTDERAHAGGFVAN